MASGDEQSCLSIDVKAFLEVDRGQCTCSHRRNCVGSCRSRCKLAVGECMLLFTT